MKKQTIEEIEEMLFHPDRNRRIKLLKKRLKKLVASQAKAKDSK